MIGETIGNFRILSRLGQGGMGEVFLAEQTSIETQVAIKVLRCEISSDREHVQRFFNEAHAVSRIKHGARPTASGGRAPSPASRCPCS